MTQPDNPLSDPAVVAALNALGVALTDLLAAAARDAPSGGEIGEGIEGLVVGIIEIAECVAAVAA
jgi:uncharacterized protein YdbL (DUF1318 family)